MKLFFYYIILSISMVSCTSVSNNDTQDEIDLKKLSDEILKKYNFEYNTIRNKQYTQLVVVQINKKNYSDSDFEIFKKEILKRKWDLTDSFNNYYNFCKNDYYTINVLNPIYDKHYTGYGERVNFESKDYWYFSLYYNKFGINNCIDYYASKRSAKPY